MNAIDFMLDHPGRFTKADICEAARQLREEIDLLNKALQRNLPANIHHEGTSS